ncbi:acyltransferase family-domain-containing protein [Pavlovales sp. CCMP2436]|nr:acyltransferase family-domain-containing protein [Pavlovales sp. CCMP2436]
MGNYELCIDDRASHHCTIRAFGGPSLGICLPRQCTVHDYLRRYKCEELLLFDSANATAALIPALANATAALLALSKALDYLAVKSKSFCAEDADYTVTPSARNLFILSGALLALVLLCTLAHSALRPACEARGLPLPPAWCEHWDAIGNSRRLLATRKDGELDFLDGMRVLSTGYVELGHMFLIAAFTSKNVVPAVGAYLQSFEATLIVGAFSAVDTFFFMSGLLCALSLLAHVDKRAADEPRTSVGVARALGQTATALVHRYLRLTPVYAYVLFFYTYALPLLGSGPLWAQSIGDGNVCERTWWTNLLYVNNLLGEDGHAGTAGCMGWSWYLANDMQFFAAAALLLPWYPSAPRWVTSLFGVSVLSSAVSAGVLSHVFRADITCLDPANADHIYGQPYTRQGTYAVGALFGIWLHERARRARHAAGDALPAAIGRAPSQTGPAPASWREVGCCVGGGVLLVAIFVLPWTDLRSGGLFERSAQEWAQWQKDTYNATQRQLWAVGLIGLSLWFIPGRGGMVRELLRAKIWQPLAKLSFGAYLWHLVVIFWLYFSALDYKTFSRLDITVNYLTVLMLSYALSYCSYLLVEKPMMNLEGALFAALARRGKHTRGVANPALSQPLVSPVAAVTAQWTEGEPPAAAT